MIRIRTARPALSLLAAIAVLLPAAPLCAQEDTWEPVTW